MAFPLVDLFRGFLYPQKEECQMCNQPQSSNSFHFIGLSEDWKLISPATMPYFYNTALHQKVGDPVPYGTAIEYRFHKGEHGYPVLEFRLAEDHTEENQGG
jgi:hypothetical protein